MQTQERGSDRAQVLMGAFQRNERGEHIADYAIALDGSSLWLGTIRDVLRTVRMDKYGANLAILAARMLVAGKIARDYPEYDTALTLAHVFTDVDKGRLQSIENIAIELDSDSISSRLLRRCRAEILESSTTENQKIALLDFAARWFDVGKNEAVSIAN